MSDQSSTTKVPAAASASNEFPEAQRGPWQGSAFAGPDSAMALTPPPPSAPVEFLGGQWLVSLLPENSGTGSELSLTPPPASAPSEFLSGQWWDASIATAEKGIENGSDFFAVLPAMNQSVEELEALAAVDTGEPGDTDSGGLGEGDGGDAQGPLSSSVRIRGVPLAVGEIIARVFIPDRGLVPEVPPEGQALILTDRRLIAFRGVEGFRDTHMARSSEIVQCSVRTGQRNWGAILQGIMIMVGGAILYLIVGYWLAGQISGPNVPVLNIDVAPLIALLIVLAGLFVLLQNYFTRPAGAMIFHGEGMEIAFPFRSSLDLEQVYDFVNLAQPEIAESSDRQVNPGAPTE